VQRKRWRLIARVVTTHGRKGEVVVAPVHGLPVLLSEGMRVACVPPQLRTDRYHDVLSVVADGGSGQRVLLSGVSDLSAAKALVGTSVLVPVDDLPADMDVEGPEAWFDREVRDRRYGMLGTITEVMVGGGNDVWVVEGPYGEVLVPVVDAIVTNCPEDDVIDVDLPDGLVGE